LSQIGKDAAENAVWIQQVNARQTFSCNQDDHRNRQQAVPPEMMGFPVPVPQGFLFRLFSHPSNEIL
jgi:hypothetical protein